MSLWKPAPDPATAPEAGIEPATKRLTIALPCQHRTLRIQFFTSDSCGIRTRPAWLERPVTSPEVERAMLFRVRVPSTQLLHVFFDCPQANRTQWTGRCSNPRLRFFRPLLNHLSYQYSCCVTLDLGTKKPGAALGDTGLPTLSVDFNRPSVTFAQDVRRAYSRLATRYNSYLHQNVRYSAVLKSLSYSNSFLF